MGISHNHSTICIETKIGNNYSYYEDVNGLLNGKWGGFHKLNEVGPNGETQYELYYSRTFPRHSHKLFSYTSWIRINEYGYFYNKFSCKRYDVVDAVGFQMYRCEKNGRFGLIDEEGHEILNTCYNEIWGISNRPVFLVRCETGWFIYNLNEHTKSEVYYQIDIIDDKYIGFDDGNGYGLLNYNGDVVIKPLFEKTGWWWSGRNRPQLQIEFKKYKFGIFIKNDLFYGRVSTLDYDYCFKVDYYENIIGTAFYVTKKGDAYGLLNARFECVSEPKLDDILLADRLETNYRRISGKHNFIICKQDNYYCLFNTVDNRCIIDGCNTMSYCLNKRHFGHNFIVFEKNGYRGFVTYNGKIISHNDYESVELFYGFFLIKKNNYYGLLSESGGMVIPFENHKITYNCGNIVLEKNGKETTMVLSSHCITNTSFYEPKHYSEFAGSYAQDEAGYSDEEIWDIFDGEPDAYWNID